jgi:hypothetical protein
MGDTRHCTKATWNPKTAFPNPLGSVHRFLGGFRKFFIPLMQNQNPCYTVLQEGYGKSVKILQHLCKIKIQVSAPVKKVQIQILKPKIL